MDSSPGPSDASVPALHTAFLALLPRLELHGRIVFRHVRCPQQREDAIQEMRALAWLWFVRLTRRGKDPGDFPSALTTFAAQAVQSGRRLCGQDRPNDVLSPHARRRRGFTVCSLPASSGLTGNVFDEALADNTRTPPDEQAAFRLDFPAWLRTRTARDRDLVGDLALGERTRAVAHKYGLSPGRVSQLRREFHADWQRYCGDPAEVGKPAADSAP